MNIIKFLQMLFLCIFFLNIDNIKADEELVPLKDLIKQQNLKSEIGELKYLANFSLQCGSLFKAINELTPNNNIMLASVNLQEGALITKIMLKKTEQRKIKEEIDTQILFTKNKYLNLMKKNLASNGDYIEGSEIINNDQKICKKFVPRFYKFLKSNNFRIKK